MRRPALTAAAKPHLNQAELEVCADAFPDAAIQGLVDDWLVAMIVDNIMEGMAETNATTGRLQTPGSCEHNKPRRAAHDDEEPQRRTPTETGQAKANAETTTVADDGRTQGAERVRRSAKPDGE